MVGLSAFMASTPSEWTLGRHPCRVYSVSLNDRRKSCPSPDPNLASGSSPAARDSQSQFSRPAVPPPLSDVSLGAISGDLRRSVKPLPETPESESSDRTAFESSLHGTDELHKSETAGHFAEYDLLPQSMRRRSSTVDEDVGDIGLFAQALSGLEDQSFAPYQTLVPASPIEQTQNFVQPTSEVESEEDTTSPSQGQVQSPYITFVPLQEYYQPSPARRPSRGSPPLSRPRHRTQLPARAQSMSYPTHSSRSQQCRHRSWLPPANQPPHVQTGTHYPLPPVDLPSEPDLHEDAENDEPESASTPPVDNTQMFAEAIQGMPPMGFQAIPDYLDQAEANRASNDELPNYAQSQREAALRARREALSRAAELERRWAASRQD